MIDRIGDLALTHHETSCTAELAGVPLPGVYADTEAAVIASRLPLDVLTELAGHGEVITVEDVEDAALGVEAATAVSTEIDDPTRGTGGR